MTKVVVHHQVRAADLPESLRAGIAPDARVTVTVEEEAPAERRTAEELVEQLRAYRASRTFRPVSAEDAVDRVRALRDEWD